MFSPARIAQMAALFAARQGGTINVLKLSKLLYLADRESLQRHGLPISFDNLVSMEHGPVLSRSLNLLNGYATRSDASQWEEWMCDRANHDVAVKRKFRREDLDQLSDADLEVLEHVWAQFGHMNQWELRDYTHTHCPEWTDPEGSSIPIKDIDVLRILGKSHEEAKELADCIQTERELDKVFTKL